MTTSDRPTRPVRRARRPRRQSRRVRLTRTIVVFVSLALVATAVVYGVKSLTPHHTVADSCQVVGQTTGTVYALEPEQLLNASIITDVAMRRGLPEQAVIIALATAQQESKLKNLDYGDADSVGLFQQRPSQGWGSEAADPRPGLLERQVLRRAGEGAELGGPHRGGGGAGGTAQRVSRRLHVVATARHRTRRGTDRD